MLWNEKRMDDNITKQYNAKGLKKNLSEFFNKIQRTYSNKPLSRSTSVATGLNEKVRNERKYSGNLFDVKSTYSKSVIALNLETNNACNNACNKDISKNLFLKKTTRKSSNTSLSSGYSSVKPYSISSYASISEVDEDEYLKKKSKLTNTQNFDKNFLLVNLKAKFSNIQQHNNQLNNNEFYNDNVSHNNHSQNEKISLSQKLFEPNNFVTTDKINLREVNDKIFYNNFNGKQIKSSNANAKEKSAATDDATISESNLSKFDVELRKMEEKSFNLSNNKKHHRYNSINQSQTPNSCNDHSSTIISRKNMFSLFPSENSQVTFTEAMFKVLIFNETKAITSNKMLRDMKISSICRKISKRIMESVKRNTKDNFKIVCNTYMGAKIDSINNFVHVSTSCQAESTKDIFLTIPYEADDYFIWVTLIINAIG